MPQASDAPQGDKLFSGECRFIMGSPRLDGLPPPEFMEIAFIGRSNVGKSSLINALTNRKGLAKASVTPGRTQHINLFLLAEQLMLVDLPGYGYAEAPKSMVDNWNRLIRAYLRHRPNLARVLVLIDSRRGVMDVDHTMMNLLDTHAVSFQLILTKIDKISAKELEKVRADTLAAAAAHPAAYPGLLATSSEKGQGLTDVRNTLAELLHSR